MSGKKNEMRILVLLWVTITGMALSHCKKNYISNNESILYGTWIKGTNTGDTLLFTNINGKNVLSYNMSFNPGLYVPTEIEYSYKEGKLNLKNYMSSSSGSFAINSFSWNQAGKEFELNGSELYPFMAATMLKFTYRKI